MSAVNTFAGAATITVGSVSRDHGAQSILRAVMARARMRIERATRSPYLSTVMTTICLVLLPKITIPAATTSVATGVLKAAVLLVRNVGAGSGEAVPSRGISIVSWIAVVDLILK